MLLRLNMNEACFFGQVWLISKLILLPVNAIGIVAYESYFRRKL